MLASKTAGITVFFVLALSLRADAQVRQWKDATGKFEVKASAVKYDGMNVYLATQDDRLLTVPVKRLSAGDQEFLKKNRVLQTLHLMSLFRYRDAYERIAKPKTAQEKAIYATLVGANLTQYMVPEFDKPKAREIAQEILNELANSENSIDCYLIANLKFRIRESDQSFEKVDVDLIQKSSEAKVPYAINRLAVCYLDGIGVEQNEERAFQLFQSLVEKYSSPIGIYNVGVCYYQGKGASENTAKGKANFKKAAEQGMVLGISAMARSLFEEIKEIKIPANLADLQQRSRRDRIAAREYAKVVSSLKKRKRLLESAEDWSQKLIDSKCSDGHFYMGLCLLQKALEPVSNQKKQARVATAYRLFEQAASKNHIQSILMLLKKALAENQANEIDELSKRLGEIALDELDEKLVAAVKATLEEAKRKL